MIASVFIEPPAIQSDINPNIILGVFVTIAIAVSVWAIRLSIKERDLLPVFAILGSFICALNEPIYDILGKIVYAENNPMAFSALGRDVPWFLVIGYIPWVGVLPIFIARLMEKGVSKSVFYKIAFGSFVSVVVVETLGNYLNGWIYYGDAPLKYLVVAPQMAPVPIVGGMLLYVLAFPLEGWKRLVATFSISTLALPMVFASASWPLYLGLYVENMPSFVYWIAGFAMLSFTVLMVVGATSIGEKIHKARNFDSSLA